MSDRKAMVYVVLSGNLGGLSRSPSMFVDYIQAAICTPSDFAFPINGIATEGIVNTQTVVIADLDLGALDIPKPRTKPRTLRLQTNGWVSSACSRRLCAVAT